MSQQTLQQLAALVATFYIEQARMMFEAGEGGYPHDDLAEYIDGMIEQELAEVVGMAVRVQLAADTAVREAN